MVRFAIKNIDSKKNPAEEAGFSIIELNIISYLNDESICS
jgi:hypothetical protein